MYKVMINNKPLYTPQDHPFTVPSLALAKAIEDEWERDSSPNYRLKPFTSLAATALDKVAREKEAYMSYLLQAIARDVLLFWTSFPEDLVKLQEEKWAPLIDEVNKTLALSLKPTFTLSAPGLFLEEEEKIRIFLDSLSAFQLTGLAHLVSLTSSFCLSFLVFLGRLVPEQAWDVAQLHEHYQQQEWGKDEDAEIREESQKKELYQTIRFIELLKS